MGLVAPVIVLLKGQPDAGQGILLTLTETLLPEKDEEGNLKRDAKGDLVMSLKATGYVAWAGNKEKLFKHDIEDLEWVEVVAVRTYEEMKEEVINDVLDVLNEDDDEESEDEPEKGAQIEEQ